MRNAAYLLCVIGLACASESNGARPGADADLLQDDSVAGPTRGSAKAEAGGAAALDVAGEDAALSQSAAVPDASMVDSLVVLDAGADGGLLACDPVSGSGCPDGQKCAVNNLGGGFIRCHGYGEGALGQLCTYSAAEDSCVLGLSCFRMDSEAKATCRRVCPWESRGTQSEICSYAPHGRCSVMYAAYKVAYCN